MNVWVCFPSVDVHKASMAKRKWQSRGYKVALFFDADRESVEADRVFFGRYQGYWNACNLMARDLVASESADIVVFAADDIDPDPNHTAQEIAAQFKEKFPDTFGVMQPAGDVQGMDQSGLPAAARICGSPWLGKEWIRRAYQGKGPTDERYWCFFGDESLKEVAEREKALWMRPDLIHFHRHWSWGHGAQTNYQRRNSTFHWDKDKRFFEQQKAEGFPGSEPIA